MPPRIYYLGRATVEIWEPGSKPKAYLTIASNSKFTLCLQLLRDPYIFDLNMKLLVYWYSSLVRVLVARTVIHSTIAEL